MKAVHKITFFLIVLGVIFNAIKTCYLQNNMEAIHFEEVFGWPFKVGFYGCVLTSMASVICFLMYRKFFPGYVSFCYVALIILVTLASYKDLGEILKSPTILYSTKGIGTFVNMGLLFFAANTLYFPKVLKLFYYLCFIFILAGLFNLSKVGFGSDRQGYLYAIRDYAVYLIWVFPFFLLQPEEDKRTNLINLGVFGMTFIFVLSTGSRSYLAIFGMFFIVKFRHQLAGKNVVLFIAGMGVLLAVAFFVIANSGLSKTVEGAFNMVSERSNEDSRSGQLMEFIAQLEPDYMVQGVGPLKTWYWSMVGEYPYLDNQFLLLGWWAGVPTLLVYMFYLIKNFFSKGEIFLYEDVQGTGLVIALWILGCLGLAIYVTISSDLYYYFITLIMGLHICKYSKIYTEEIEEA